MHSEAEGLTKSVLSRGLAVQYIVWESKDLGYKREGFSPETTIWEKREERKEKSEKNKKKRQSSVENCRFFLAESVRFELTVGRPITSFQD